MSSTRLLHYPTNTNKQVWGQLPGSGLSLALAEFCSKMHGILCIISPNSFIANQCFDELNFFLNSQEATPELLLFPDWETLPYDQFSPHQDLISQRLTTLYRLKHSTHAVLISSIGTLMHHLCPPEFLDQHAFILKEGQHLDRERFLLQMQQSAYHCVTQVLEHGEYALRGSILDIYPMGSPHPLRIELFDDSIASLRLFDADTQRTIEKINQINLLPAREFPFNETSIALFRQQFRKQFSSNPSRCPVYEAISNQQFPSGIEYYLPLFFHKTASIFDYLPPSTPLFFVENVATAAEQFWQELTGRHEQRCHDVSRPILNPEQCFLKPNAWFSAAKDYPQIRLQQSPVADKGAAFNFPMAPVPTLLIDRKNNNPLAKLQNYLERPEWRSLIVVETAGRREVLLDLFKQNGLSAKTLTTWQEFLRGKETINILVGALVDGMELSEKRLAILVEAQLFGFQATPQRRHTSKQTSPDLIFRDLLELTQGAPVVHLEFGVGRYQGLQTIETGGQSNEFLVLKYAHDDTIYVPVTSLHLISRYTGLDSEHAPLHKLGSDVWSRDKKKALEKIHDVAIELLEIYAKRNAAPGISYQLNAADYQRFASEFPFAETPDQITAIEAILQDMQSTRPMDRLICGDVGFGKTEVAMRAAFIAVQNNKQVCVLVPTTLLAAQHFETFRDRFADFPVNIELLSRFRTTKETTQVISAAQEGRVDILIGTHKLFSQEVQFKALGLLIIDEEHRFGVKQKEHLKRLRTHVDILSMTATPIPRTLNMAMAGIRDISLITSPPAKRLAIKTFWQEKNAPLVREAILREILRGGQVFYLHNDVQTIERVRQDLQTLVPEAKIEKAHGQLRERELEKIMSDFYHHRFNVLVCTTIIETGIDIPTANTIIIDRADKFGLAQLHQLRGRVGRSHHQAYAYLFTPPEKTLTADTLKRLEALVSLEELGAGFMLATHDLEIRGAGELLGEEQSGNMHALGFTLFMEMLDRAVHDLKSGKTPELNTPLQQGPEIDLGVSAILPDTYIPDVHTRLIVYKRIANAKNSAQLRDLQIEMIDRFGLLPDSAKQLLEITELKFAAEKLGIKKMRVTQQLCKIEFTDHPNIDLPTLIQLIQIEPEKYQMEGATRLRYILENSKNEEKIQEIKWLFNRLGTNQK